MLADCAGTFYRFQIIAICYRAFRLAVWGSPDCTKVAEVDDLLALFRVVSSTPSHHLTARGLIKIFRESNSCVLFQGVSRAKKNP